MSLLRSIDPVILRLAQQKGMQDADADDVAQQILVSVVRAVEKREHDPQRAKFRTWLNRVAHNAILNALTRGKPDRGSGGSVLLYALNDQETPTGPASDLLRLEHRARRYSAGRHGKSVKSSRQDTWEAFWQTAIEERSVEDVAAGLGKNPGSIYAARSRIIRRIQEKVMEYREED